MKTFIELFESLDRTTKTNEKLAALQVFFQQTDDLDALWAVALLTGKRPKRPVKTTLLREWAAEQAGISNELFEDTYHVVGDLAETIALLLPPQPHSMNESLHRVMVELIELREETEAAKKEYVLKRWSQLSKTGRFVFNKLITGGYRIGVSRKLMTRALATYLDTDEAAIAHRLMGNWSPVEVSFEDLFRSEDQKDDLSKPYPFYLAYPLEDKAAIQNRKDWQAEYKWDGIRGQLIVRSGQAFLWSRGEELVTDRYPEIEELKQSIPDGTVLDGEILAWKDQPLPFQMLQKRIGRKKVSAQMMKKVPVVFMAYDMLEWKGEDIRHLTMRERRMHLEKLDQQLDDVAWKLSPVIDAPEVKDLEKLRDGAREKFAEGLMLKQLDSPYRDGRKRGEWWKWKVDPMHIDAVMIYAQRGHGRRANLYTDFTFAVWKGDELVPFTKAYSGLTDEELKKVDRFVKQHTRERFGPVRSVDPELVFELAFEGIVKSSRHKSGIALRFPRIKRWRTDKPAQEANTLKDLTALLEAYGPREKKD